MLGSEATSPSLSERSEKYEVMGHVKWSETNDSKEWDDFVVQNGGSTFHLWSWRKVLESDDSRPLYLACRDARGEILAVCPFFYRGGRHLLYLDSLPDSLMAGPIIGSRTANPTQIIASLRNAVRFSPFNPVVAMRIRVHQKPVIQSMLSLGFRHDAITHGLLLLDLQEKTPEHIWNNGFQKHDRRAVKFFEQKSASFGIAKDESDYHDYLSLARGSLWHPNDSSEFLAARLSKMRLNLGDKLIVTLATFENEVIAGLPVLCDTANSTVHLGIVRFSSLRNIHEPMANVTYINWKVVNWAFEHGFRHVDFGSYSIAESSNVEHPFYKLRGRFELVSVPWYRFTLPTSRISLPVARRINRVLRGVKGSTPNVVVRKHRSPRQKPPDQHNSLEAS